MAEFGLNEDRLSGMVTIPLDDPSQPQQRQSMARKKIHGVLLLDKPVGISSNSALQQARWLYQAEKAGHGGTLDPFASGLLPVLFGEAAKFGRYYLDGDKTYEATLAFGYETDSGDLTGTPTRHAPVPNLDCVDWAALCARFSGAQQQTPPAYSALKIDGERAYDLARRGETPELAARPITIHELHYLGPDPAVADSARFRVRCSKGTYIRSLLQDLATALDSAGHTAALRRLAVAQHHDMTPLATCRWIPALPTSRVLTFPPLNSASSGTATTSPAPTPAANTPSMPMVPSSASVSAKTTVSIPCVSVPYRP